MAVQYSPQSFDPFAGIVEGLRSAAKQDTAMAQLAGTQLGGQAVQRLANAGAMDRQLAANKGQLDVTNLTLPAVNTTANANLLKAGGIPTTPEFSPPDLTSPRKFDPASSVGAMAAALGAITNKDQVQREAIVTPSGKPLGALEKQTTTQSTTDKTNKTRPKTSAATPPPAGAQQTDSPDALRIVLRHIQTQFPQAGVTDVIAIDRQRQVVTVRRADGGQAEVPLATFRMSAD